MGSLYLASKLEECPLRIRDLVNVFDLLMQRARCETTLNRFEYTPMTYHADQFYILKDSIVVAEMQMLKRLGFNVRGVLPHGALVNYLRVLGLVGDNSREVCSTAWGYLNDS